MEASLLIDNKDVPAADGKVFERRDPLTGELVTRAAAATVADAKAAVDAAAAAFPAWARILPSERRTLLLKAADILASRAADFTDVQMGETGAAASWVGFNIGLAANEGQRLWPLRRSGGDQRIHRVALDHDRDRAASLPLLKMSRRP